MLIFGIILGLIGAGVGAYFLTFKQIEEAHYKTDKWGDYVKDSNGNKIYVEETTVKPLKKYCAIPFVAGALLCMTCLVFSPYSFVTVIPTGVTGVVTKFGKVESETLEAGLKFKSPVVKIIKLDNRVQSLDIDTSTYSTDNQTIDVSVNLQYEINKADADKIILTYGTVDKLEARIKAIALDNIKSIFAQNTAEDVIKKRAEISTKITEKVSNSLNSEYFIDVKTVVLTNIEFTPDFEAAVAAKVAQEQKKQQALIEQAQKLAEAENEAKIATVKAEAEKEVAIKKAEADMEVAKIAADSAEYQGKKDAAIALQGLAACNGWTVVQYIEADGTSYNKLVGVDGNVITATQLEAGVKNYIEKLKNEKWDGKLPVYMMGTDSTVTVVTP